MSNSAIDTTDYRKFREGTLANRPAANAVVVGTFYLVTDSTPAGALWRSDGTNWVRVDAVPDFNARVYNTASQSVPHATTTALTFNTTLEDSGGFYSSSQPSRLTVPTDGFYMIMGNVNWEANTAGRRNVHVWLNRATMIAVDGRPPVSVSGAVTPHSISCLWRLVAGDYVELAAYQDSGAARTVWADAHYGCQFRISRLSP